MLVLFCPVMDTYTTLGFSLSPSLPLPPHMKLSQLGSPNDVPC